MTEDAARRCDKSIRFSPDFSGESLAFRCHDNWCIRGNMRIRCKSSDHIVKATEILKDNQTNSLVFYAFNLLRLKCGHLCLKS